MIHFVLYVLSVAFSLSVGGLFVFLAGRLVLRDSRDLLRYSLRALVGSVDFSLGRSAGSRRTAALQHIQVQAAGSNAGVAIGDKLPLTLPMTHIGREEDNDIVLMDSGVSGRHLSLSFERGAWFLIDRKSRNGTRIMRADGELVQAGKEPEIIGQEDEIVLGSVHLRLVP